MSFSAIKAVVRRIQEQLERGLLGTHLQEWIWRTRHLYRKDWAQGYLGSVNHPHRRQLIEAVLSFEDVVSVLEVGCASGANLICLRTRLPSAQLVGVDINNAAIKLATRHFEALGDANIRFIVGRADSLIAIPDASADVVVTDALLMFIAPDRISEVLSEIGRVARKGFVLNEYHLDGEGAGLFDGGRWVYDLVHLIELQFPHASVHARKSAFSGGAWDEYGTLMEVRL